MEQAITEQNPIQKEEEFDYTDKGKKFETAAAQIDPELLKNWNKQQLELKGKIIENDDPDFVLENVKHIAGMDISMSKTNDKKGCASLVVLTFPELKIAYEEHLIVDVEQPYVPGFLAFKEAPALLYLLDRFKNSSEIHIDLVLVDGNGILHTNACGLASHLGVLIDKPTIGCGKKIFCVDGLSMEMRNKIKDKFALPETPKGAWEYLVGDSGRVWGAGLKSGPNVKDPLIVSIGHRISLDTAVKIVDMCCLTRVAEPIKIADKKSRSIINKFDNN